MEHSCDETMNNIMLPLRNLRSACLENLTTTNTTQLPEVSLVFVYFVSGCSLQNQIIIHSGEIN